MYVFFLNLFK